MNNQKNTIVAVVIIIAVIIIAGFICKGTMRGIAEEEAAIAVSNYAESFQPKTFGFGAAWEKEFSYAQGVKTGNMIFVAGQLAHSQEVDENGMPEFLMGDFEQQLRASLDNVKAVLASYGATMDDVVFLQNFVDADANGNMAGDYYPVFARVISEYFPKGLHAMTIAEVVDLFGPLQLVESNAIAVIR